MKTIVSFLTVISLFACRQAVVVNGDLKAIQFITPLGDTLYDPDITTGTAFEKFLLAKSQYEKEPKNADNIIWLGRRTAYLGKYQEAISIFSEGINQHPNDARMYRHRAHRFITTRQYQKAIEDLEKASQLIQGQPDEVEPDGMPNAQNIPVSSLHDNVWYHLGLAYYLIDDLPNALRAFNTCRQLERNPDMIVSASHWLYMIHRRMNNESGAVGVLASINKDMVIIENTVYHRLCLFYKNELDLGALLNDEANGASQDAILYGVANWHLYHEKDLNDARAYFEKLLKNGNKASFAYLAAEADFVQIFKTSTDE